jgi:hypothetical protein
MPLTVESIGKESDWEWLEKLIPRLAACSLLAMAAILAFSDLFFNNVFIPRATVLGRIVFYPRVLFMVLLLISMWREASREGR